MEEMRAREKKRREGMMTRLAASRERHSVTDPHPHPHRNWVDWLNNAGFEGCNVYVKIINGGLTTTGLGGEVGFNFSEAAAVGEGPT